MERRHYEEHGRNNGHSTGYQQGYQQSGNMGRSGDDYSTSRQQSRYPEYSDFSRDSQSYSTGYGSGSRGDRESGMGGYGFQREEGGFSGRGASFGGAGHQGGSQGHQYGSQGIGSGSYQSGRNWGGQSSGQFGGQSGNFGYGQRGRQGVTGRFAGIGPKGYKKSKQRIEEQVNEALTDHPEINAQSIEVIVEESGDIILRGTVDSREAKRLAEDVAESCARGCDVRNELRVSKEQSSGGSGSTSGFGSSARSGSSSSSDEETSKSGKGSK